MTNLLDIERAIEQLSAEQLKELRVWLAEREAADWDQEFEKDVAAGRLDTLGERALQDLKEGRCTDL